MERVEDLKKAFEILGVPETADMKQMEDRYFILMRRQKSRQQQASHANTNDDDNFEEINQAYKLLKAHFVEQTMKSSPLYMKEQQKSPRRQKIEHFLSYYKWPLIGSIVGLAIIIMVVNSIVNKKPEIPANASVMLVGDYYLQDTAPLETALAGEVSGWQRVKVTDAYSPSTSDGTDYAYQQKAMVLLATERPDIYVVDDLQFQRVGNQQAFMPLDKYESMFKELLPADRLLYTKYDNDTEQHLYGIDLTGNPVFKNILADKVKKIFAIRSTVKDPSNALELIKAMISSLPATDQPAQASP